MANKININVVLGSQYDGKGVDEMTRGLDAVREVLGQVNQQSGNTAESISGVAHAMMAVEQGINAIQRLQAVMHDLTAAYAVQEQAERKLETVMRNTMGATDEQIQSIKDYCSAQQQIGVVGDEVQLAGAQELATYLTMTETLQALIPVMNDMAVQQYGVAVSGEQAAGIATMLGKVMNGQVSALSRYGYTFDEAQEQILKTGTEMERAAVLAEVVGQSVGGMNEQMRATASGATQAMTNALGDMKEQAGALVAKLMPTIDAVASTGIAVASLYQGYKILKPAIVSATTAVRGFGIAAKGALISTGIGAVIAAIAVAYEAMAGAADKAAEATGKIKAAEQSAAQAHAAATKELQDHITVLRNGIAANADMSDTVADLNTKYGDALGQYKTAAEWLKTLTERTKDYAMAKAYEARAIKLSGDLLEVQAEMELMWQRGAAKKRKIDGGGYTDAYKQLLDQERQLTRAIEANERKMQQGGINIAPAMSNGSRVKSNEKTPNSRLKTQDSRPPEAGSFDWYGKRIKELDVQINAESDEGIRADLELMRQRLQAQLDAKKLTMQVQAREAAFQESGLTMAGPLQGSAIKLGGDFTPPASLNLPEVKQAPDVVKADQVAQVKAMTGAVSALANAARGMSGVLGEGASAWLNYGVTIINAVAEALPAVVALTTANAANSAAQTPVVGWITAIAAIASVGAALATLPKFADGGIAYGPTVGLFGEYAGAANNPEVVAPLDKLRDLIGDPGNADPKVLRVEIDGRKLVALIGKEQRLTNRR